MKKVRAIAVAFTLTVGITQRHTVEAVIQKFSDLGKHWASVTVEKLVDSGVISGYSDGTFRPDNTINRGEFTRLVRTSLNWETEKGNSFEDINKHWAKDDIQTVLSNGGIDKAEYGDKFEPNTEITRLEMAKMIVRSLGLDENAKEKSGDTTGFNDEEDISKEDRGYIILATENKIIAGYPDKTFRPDGKATRAEASQMIINMIEVINKEGEKGDSKEEKEEVKEDKDIKEESKGTTIDRINETLKTREVNNTLPKGVKSIAKYEKPQTYEELQENIESLKEYGYSGAKKTNWEIMALDQVVSNPEAWYYSEYTVGVIKMDSFKYERLGELLFEGKTYNMLDSKDLIDKKFTNGVLIKDGEIIDIMAKTSDSYTLGVWDSENVYKADYLGFKIVAMEMFPDSIKFKYWADHILVLFENPFKKN